MLWVNKVAISASLTGAFVILAALGLPEVSDWAVFYVHLLHIVISPILVLEAPLRLLLSCELDEDIPYHMVSDVIGDQHLQYFTILAEFCVNLSIKLLTMSSRGQQLLLRHTQPSCKGNSSSWILIQLEKQQSLTERRLVVLPCAAIPVSTRSNFVVEGTIDFVVFGAEFLGESLCHFVNMIKLKFIK